jgi:hypothetical protein
VNESTTSRDNGRSRPRGRDIVNAVAKSEPRLQPFGFRVVGGNEDVAAHTFYAANERQAATFARTWAQARGLELELVGPKVST